MLELHRPRARSSRSRRTCASRLLRARRRGARRGPLPRVRALGAAASATARRAAGAVPAAARGVRRPGRGRGDARRRPRLRIGEWERSWNDAATRPRSRPCATAIARGDVYQVNLVQHLSAPFAGDPAGLAARSRALAARASRSRATAGRSCRRRRSSSSRAAAGACGRCRSRARARSGERRLAGREGRRRARDDRRPRAQRPLARLRAGLGPLAAADGRARARRRRRTSSRPSRGRLREDVALAELLAATFPGGSVTGAPKIAARRPDRGARAGRARRVDGRARASARTATSSSR